MNKNAGYGFAPNVKASYDVTKTCALGLEYYGSVGQLTHFDAYQMQQHQLFIAADLNLSPDWEVNFGYGEGFTKATDNAIVKLLVGYRLHRN